MHGLRIPKERIGVLIGKKGEVKQQIENSTKTKLDIDSKEGDVSITGEDGIGLFHAKEVVIAIGRGFNPDIALLLLKQDYMLEVINLGDYCNKKKSALSRIRGRLIGREGKSRHIVEELTESYVSVYGKTVAIIGLAENITIARDAIQMLLKGSPHSTVYRWLERQRKKIREAELV